MRPAVAFPLLACLLLACVKIDGGAVEISWVIRTKTGSAITDCGCASPTIDKVRLELVGCLATAGGGCATGPVDGGTMATGGVVGTTPCAGQAQCDFPCSRQTGSTAFNIPETHGDERYEISVVAVGVDGSELTSVMHPDQILREVVRGQPTEVESMQLVADCAMACQMNSSGVCARP